MKKGLERLFWAVGGILLLPFVIQQTVVLSHSDARKSEVPQLISTPVLQPATATAIDAAHEHPAETAGDSAAPTRHIQKESPSPDANEQALEPDTSLWSASRIAAWGEMINLMDRPVGTLLIPSLDVEVPVFPDTSEVALTLGAGVIPGTADVNGAGNIGMASHRDGHFRHLRKVAVGDLLLLKTASSLRQFRVVETRVVEPSDTWVLEAGEQSSMTLVTCYPFQFVGSAPQRYIVSAQEVQSDLTQVRLSNSVIGGHHETLKF